MNRKQYCGLASMLFSGNYGGPYQYFKGSRGIDQVLPYPSAPVLHESYVRDATRDSLKLAEAAKGPIQKPVDYAYVSGDGLAVLSYIKPDLRIIYLETSVTTFCPRRL